MLTHFVGTSYSSALATRPKKRIMSMIYKHGQRYGLIPRNQESNPMHFVRCKTTSGYEAMILTPEQAYAVLLNLQAYAYTSRLRHGSSHLRMLGPAMARRKFR